MTLKLMAVWSLDKQRTTSPNTRTGVLISPYSDPTEKQMKGRHFVSDAKVIAAAETWLDGQTYEFFVFEWLANIRV